jgi:molybdopterin/thiamine biosynthesis adenylyltransferase
MGHELNYSRPQRTADVLGELAEDRHRFLEKMVLLTGEDACLATQNGERCLLDSMRLLVRISRNLTVRLPSGFIELTQKARALATQISFGSEVAFVEGQDNLAKYDAILSVGSSVRPDLPWTAINSNGWLARASSGDRPLSEDCFTANPISALAAACLGAGEVWKRLIRLKPQRAELLNGFVFSLRSYSASNDIGPALPSELPGEVLIVGGGAIGNGVVHLIRQLPFSSALIIVDRQSFEDENLGTCLLIGPRDLGRPKASVLASVLTASGKNATAFNGDFAAFVDRTSHLPRLVLSALDNIDVRHEVQRMLWPDVLIDGAIGDLTCQVSRHPWGENVACAICLFRQPDGPSATEVQAEATGLSPQRLTSMDSSITEEDVLAAPPTKREFLRLQIGQQICSVVQTAIAQKLSQDKQKEDFRPSVPFVAGFSACMVVSEMIAHIAHWPSVIEPRFQFDFLRGPGYGQLLPQERRAACLCKRTSVIEKVRARQKAAP